jgi:hypothetical protein
MTCIAEINDVVYECLDACFEAKDPEQRLEQFFRALRRQGDWSGSEVEEIESTARMLMDGYFDRRHSAVPSAVLSTPAPAAA